VVPRLFAEDAAGLVAFMRQVFEATGRAHPDRPTELRIGDSLIMVNDTSARSAQAAFLYVYVPDVDATYRRAIAAGAESIEAPKLLAYGDRRAMIEDRWGNTWQIAARVRRDT
jgi:uncharacterized glyoxalase superfamily protein PhnB